MRPTLVLATVVLVAFSACGERAPSPRQDVELERPVDAARTHRDFAAYYHRGLAELNRYALSQSRYGEIHEGEAVLIFVIEEVHQTTQVRYEGGDREGVIETLKSIAHRSFSTGIYPYSVSTAIYDPVDPARPSPLKAVGSVIEWSGSTFMQWNRDAAGFRVVAHSYFQGESDREAELPDAILEDAFFTQIRIDPRALPTGARMVVPGLHHLRLEHLPLQGYAARLERDRARHSSAEGELERYTITYPEIGRTLRIYFGRTFPHEIYGFEEELAEGGEVLRTEAIRTNVGLDAYWTHNRREHAPYRAALGLTGGQQGGPGSAKLRRIPAN
ncbi:MAG: septum formation inhibitor Maf [Polyangiaceae bacterium]|nr:septum formation inhibitor Maf [Polyangiaceae bacterium]